MDGSTLKVVPNFKYLGGWMDSSESDIRSRKALACRALHHMKKIWRSGMSNTLKRRLFTASVESVLVYGAEAWTMTAAQEAALDGCYTRMMRMALNVSWKDHMTNVQLYDGYQKLSNKIRERRLKLASHCARHPELAANPLILWEPAQGNAPGGGGKKSYVDVLKRDTG